MKKGIPAGLRLTFLANFVVGGLIGLQHLLAPRLWTDLAGMEIGETVTWRGLGAALLGFAAGSWLASREERWERVRIVVVMQVVWSVLGALVILWGLLFEGLPPLEWVNVGLLAAFAVAFGVFLARMEGGRGAWREGGREGVGELVAVMEQIVAVAEVDAVLWVTEGGELPGRLRELAASRRVIVATGNGSTCRALREEGLETLHLPVEAPNRYNQVQLVLSGVLRSGLLSSGELVLCVFGPDVYPEEGGFVLLTRLGPESGYLVATGDLVALTDGVELEVLEKALRLGCRIGQVTQRAEERKGAIFMLGDVEGVLEGSQQLVPNPFLGHEGAVRQFTSEEVDDAIVELAKLDGAFVIDGDGFIEAAGVFLATGNMEIGLPPGLGARHRAAAAVTARTEATAVVVSATDGNVRVFADGELALKVDPAVPYGAVRE